MNKKMHYAQKLYCAQKMNVVNTKCIIAQKMQCKEKCIEQKIIYVIKNNAFLKTYAFLKIFIFCPFLDIAYRHYHVGYFGYSVNIKL